MDKRHAYDSVVDMTYTVEFDVFSLKARDVPTHDISLTALGEDTDDFIAFDNTEPGRMVSATFQADNEIALTAMTSFFDTEFTTTAHAMRTGAHLYEKSAIHAEITVPYANSRRLARIALHAASKTAPAAIKILAEKVA